MSSDIRTYLNALDAPVRNAEAEVNRLAIETARHDKAVAAAQVKADTANAVLASLVAARTPVATKLDEARLVLAAAEAVRANDPVRQQVDAVIAKIDAALRGR